VAFGGILRGVPDVTLQTEFEFRIVPKRKRNSPSE
jgi:hypothetical protein